MGELKTLADCTPHEFMRQTVRIKDSAEKWLKMTDLMGIRATNDTEYEQVKDGMSIDERAEVIGRNKKKLLEQAQKNLSKMFDAMMKDHPEETLELLALCCFVEPENVDDHPIYEYMDAFTSLINNKSVIGFFTSLLALAQTNISAQSKA